MSTLIAFLASSVGLLALALFVISFIRQPLARVDRQALAEFRETRRASRTGR